MPPRGPGREGERARLEPESFEDLRQPRCSSEFGADRPVRFAVFFVHGFDHHECFLGLAVEAENDGEFTF